MRPLPIAALALLTTAALALGADNPAPAATTKPKPVIFLQVLPLEYPVAELLSPAGRQRLKIERDSMAQELLDNATWDGHKVDAAVAKMQGGAADTVQDNTLRFSEAEAALHDKFGSAYRLYREKRWDDAGEAFNALLWEKVVLIKARRKHNVLPPYAYCVAKNMYAECVGRAGDISAAIIAYQIVYHKLPGSLTLALPARMRAAQMYELTNRAHFAIPIYDQVLAQHGKYLAETEVKRLRAHLENLITNDAFRNAPQEAQTLVERVKKGDLSLATVAAQKKFAETLNLLLVEAEEEDRPFLEHSEFLSTGTDSGALKAGSPGRASPLGDDPPKGGSDDWGQLKARDKQQLLELFKQTYPERYREMLEAYYRNISNAETTRKE